MGIEEFKAKKEAEKAQEAAQEAPTVSDARAQLAEMQKKLDEIERKTGNSGLVPAATKEQLLDARDVASKHPDKRLRWISLVSEKVQSRMAQGYVRIPMAEGGRQVGNLALFGIPRDVYERRVEDIKRRNKERLSAHKTEVEAMAEAVAKELRDRHGINVSAEKIMISE